MYMTGVRRLTNGCKRQLLLALSIGIAGAVSLSTSFSLSATQMRPVDTPALAADSVSSQAATGWAQDGHDAQHTGWTPEEPAEPWTYAWSWNGPDASGGTGNHLYNAPAEARTVAGGGRIYVPAGANGLYALNETTGAQVWHVAGTFNATPAYDPATGAVFAGGADGNLYRIPANTGAPLLPYPAGSPINKAILVVGSFVYAVTDSGQLHKVSTATMSPAWVYTGGSQGSTPPSWSASRDIIIFATADLFVHAVRNANGSQFWHVRPSPNPAGFPYTFNRGWPVIAEQHGIVFLRMQLDHSFMSDYPSAGNIYPSTNAQVRSFLQANQSHKNLFALNLDNGSEKFVPAVGYGSTEDFINGAAYGVMGSQPVVKVWPDGTEVAYIHFRNGQSAPQDYRDDGHMGEMVLDDTTVPGMVAGDLRFVCMQAPQQSAACSGVAYVNKVDEQEPITLAGSTIFHAHWGASESVKITDRSNTLGLSYANPIRTSKHPTVIRQQQTCSNKNTATHVTTCGLTLFQDGRFWAGPGFWVYWNVVAPPGSPQPNAYSAGFLPRYTYVSDGFIITEGNGGELFVLRYSGGISVPTLSSINPSSGDSAGGTGITVTGSGFQPGAGLAIGGANATNTTVSNATTITGITVPHAAGLVSVTVTNPDGGTATLLNSYRYTGPAAPGFTAPEPVPRSGGGGGGLPDPPVARTGGTITGASPRPVQTPR
jgi:outer membrane protein assembly factor BamB